MAAQRSRALRLILAAALLLGVPLAVLRPGPAAAANVGCDPNPATRANDLVGAVQAAVTAGGAQIIDLAAGCTYTLTLVNNLLGGVSANNATGLPVIPAGVTLKSMPMAPSSSGRPRRPRSGCSAYSGPSICTT